MNSTRKTKQLITPKAVVEGAGVKLKRSIGTRTLDYLDPFLLLDHFDSKNPADYEAGFPLHPHRGIETVTYVLSGAVNHKDTLGSAGTIRAGDVQWMTAGRGIMHAEMPQVRPEGIAGFQLWVNLPAKLKMTQPRYQEISAGEIPEIQRGGAKIRVISGQVDGVKGPISGIAADPIYMDVTLAPTSIFVQTINPDHTAFAYLFEGEAAFPAGDGNEEMLIQHSRLAVLGESDEMQIVSREKPARFLLVSAKPLSEPIARYGPFVMN